MTEIERLWAAAADFGRDAAVYAALNAYAARDAAVDAADADLNAALDVAYAACNSAYVDANKVYKAALAALAAQPKEQTND
jgi:hypothetical protein